MSDEPLQPIEQREVPLGDGTVTAALVQIGGMERVYVPVRPICEALGVNWPSQTRRIRNDEILSGEVQGVAVMTTPSEDGRGGGVQTMLSLPLEFVHGWLFGFQVARVKPEHRGALARYKKECYRVLFDAFYQRALSRRVDDVEGRVGTLEGRVDQAAVVVGRLLTSVSEAERRLQGVEERTGMGEVLTPAEATTVRKRVDEVAGKLGGVPGYGGRRKPHPAVYSEMYRLFGVTTYHELTRGQYAKVIAWLDDWYHQLDRLLSDEEQD